MKPTKAIRENVREPKEGQVVILIGPWIWGKGTTVEKAFTQMKKEGDYYHQDLCLAYHCHPDTCVNGMGALQYPGDHPPVLVAEINKKVAGSTALHHNVF